MSRGLCYRRGSLTCLLCGPGPVAAKATCMRCALSSMAAVIKSIRNVLQEERHQGKALRPRKCNSAGLCFAQAISGTSTGRSKSMSRTAAGVFPELESPTDSTLSSSLRIPLSQFVRKSAPIEVQGSLGSGPGKKPPAWGSSAQPGLEGTSPPSGLSFRNIQVCSSFRTSAKVSPDGFIAFLAGQQSKSFLP